MKKILFLISALFLINPVFAQENLNAMPTDEEIMQTIQKFGFNKEQQEYLFKETKKKLQETYATGKIQQEVEVMKNNPITTGIMQENPVLLPELENINKETPKKVVKKREKKYSKHDPLTRRSKREALENQ